MTTRTNKMPKKTKSVSPTTLRKHLNAANAEIAALKKDLEEAEKSARHYAACYEAQLTTVKNVRDSQEVTNCNLRTARNESAFAPTADVITNEPDRVLRLAWCEEKEQFSIITDRDMLHVTLSIDELEALYNLLRLGPASA